MIDFKKTALE